MTKLTWLDFILRLIPEGFLIMMAGYAVAKRKIAWKPYVVSSFLFAVITLLLKVLPISAVLPMLLSATTAVILLILINKIKAMHAILSTLVCFILSLLLEGLNVVVLGKVMGLDTELIFERSGALVKNLYSLPSLALFALLIILYYRFRTKKEA